MEDQVFIERLEPIDRDRTGQIVVTDMETADNKMLLRKGRVLSVGPGKWIPGTWWHFKTGWEWLDGYREKPTVKPGDLVIFNARWNDLRHGELRPIGADRHSRTAPLERPLSYLYDERVHLVQENDIAGIIHE
jgi:co-chaperonin GroES (HSP10)